MSQNRMDGGHWLLLIVGGLALGNLIFEANDPCPNRIVILLHSVVMSIEFGIFHFFTVNKQRHD